MLKIQEIREIIKLIDQSSIQKFTFEADGGKIKLEKNAGTVVAEATPAPVAAAPGPVAAPVVTPEPVAAAPAPAPVAEVAAPAPAAEVAEDASLHKITSPMVGTYYQAPSPDAAAYVKKGDKVTAESIVCIVEAMKLFNEIEAEVSGEIVEILVQDGQLVEYGQPLFLVREN
ncbi:acetyl-CoA carboxylase biotin carboxyl carrier protein [Sporosarcina sp. GW1-11]|uniref:acetyl-CoA carboxylase biotin carboxyl carrier protein n=1 Tax=Sporosarcina sp. GW1-11 TaxID=2899126 RepID=UPI00294F515B|nr:acetyl-CoA carboxylase biotin carboxyl carrier protein [Sporosarcina sp. GW1-11]MDV6377835.1 acetyl-CoA carboxylase biotin carboxyl carrier protein [Sporosarcina sp. GW1-11]